MKVTYLEPKSDSFERLKFENEILRRETDRLHVIQKGMDIKYKKNPTEANRRKAQIAYMKYSACLTKAVDATLLYSRAFNLHYDIDNSHLRIVK
jgi:hypothetical protein